MNPTRSLPRRTSLAAAAAIAAFAALAGCGSSHTSSSPTSSPSDPATSASSTPLSVQHDQADVAFAQQMISHHRQAITMAALAQERASSNEVKSLAERVKKAQAPEIATMTTWLKSWGEQVPQDMNGMDGMGHGNASAMPGMMSDHDMAQLKGASGHAFDTMFLSMMITHHQGAIRMATTEERQGTYGPAKKMAANIVTSQTAEITEMRAMLGTTSPSAAAH
ncbi:MULTISPECIES: DUF305 domain-containing protein [unclassified Streptomyces]|uniref:DUF305 domain-containing protein n=1 Tax=unclassified Streptomyces TaxID=2593676 RepID=UPI004041EABD